MKIKRINAAFFQGIKFNAYSKATAELDETALNMAYKVLFGGQDFHSITKEEATRVNQLLKTCEHLLNRYCVADAPNINNITAFPYLSKAINEFYRECSAGKDFLESQRTAEEKTKSKLGRIYYKGKDYFVRKLYLGDLFRDRNDWLPKRTKTYLRGAFNETFGVYPEQLYAAFTFYLVKDFYPDLTGPASWQIKQILHLIKHEISVRHAQKERGTESHKNTDYEALYEEVREEFISGQLFKYCYQWQSLYYMLRADYRIGDETARQFIKRLKNEFPDSVVFKKNKSRKDPFSKLLCIFYTLG